MATALDRRVSSPGLSPSQGHCVVFLALNSDSAFLHSDSHSNFLGHFCPRGKGA